MRVYLDSSAIVKRLFDEPEAQPLRQAILGGSTVGLQFVTSALARVEVSRVARMRIDADAPRDVAVATAEAFLGIAIAELARPILESARIIGPPVLRSLDAIHVATAVAAGADELWTYDQRMSDAAEGLGIRVRMPS